MKVLLRQRDLSDGYLRSAAQTGADGHRRAQRREPAQHYQSCTAPSGRLRCGGS